MSRRCAAAARACAMHMHALHAEAQSHDIMPRAKSMAVVVDGVQCRLNFKTSLIIVGSREDRRRAGLSVLGRRANCAPDCMYWRRSDMVNLLNESA